MKPPARPLTPLYWPFKVPVIAEYQRHQKEARELLQAWLDKIPPSPM